MNASAISGPPGPNPPRFTTPLAWVLKKLSTVILFANPVPFTVIVSPDCVTEVTEIACPIGTDTALLALPSPSLITSNDPGPVVGALAPLAGSTNAMRLEVRPGSPGSKMNGPTLPPGQSQNNFTATPWTTSKPLPPSSTALPWITTVSTL